MQELLEVLEQEEKQYEKLIELNDIKRDSVIKANIDELGKVTTQEQEIASVLLNLSNKRGGILNDMATVLGKEPKDMTINKMIGYLESQPEEQKLLIERRDRLLEVGTQMRMLNQQNEALLNQALEMVEFDLTLLRSMRQAPETANYNRNAYNTGDLLGSSGFDAKQ
ncbi:MAG: flagellar export chaperone FlgN [Clostridiales bacterium]|nr:flagellar protein FlgN [Roseburia sp.]MDD7636169.1 flagellar export chaperone FlgN [Clostridiales bacterium]